MFEGGLYAGKRKKKTSKTTNMIRHDKIELKLYLEK